MATREQEAPRVLAEDDRMVLRAVAARIFPKTDSPGALEIGAVEYIETALAGDYAALVPHYEQGLRALQRQAYTKYKKRFWELSDDHQDAMLREFEAGNAEHFKGAAEFFETVRYHVLEGVFCEPEYGGNKNLTGWRIVDFPGQQFGYSDAYINKRVDLKPVAVDSRKAGVK